MDFLKSFASRDLQVEFAFKLKEIRNLFQRIKTMTRFLVMHLKYTEPHIISFICILTFDSS